MGTGSPGASRGWTHTALHQRHKKWEGKFIWGARGNPVIESSPVRLITRRLATLNSSRKTRKRWLLVKISVLHPRHPRRASHPFLSPVSIPPERATDSSSAPAPRHHQMLHRHGRIDEDITAPSEGAVTPARRTCKQRLFRLWRHHVETVDNEHMPPPRQHSRHKLVDTPRPYPCPQHPQWRGAVEHQPPPDARHLQQPDGQPVRGGSEKAPQPRRARVGGVDEQARKDTRRWGWLRVTGRVRRRQRRGRGRGDGGRGELQWQRRQCVPRVVPPEGMRGGRAREGGSDDVEVIVANKGDCRPGETADRRGGAPSSGPSGDTRKQTKTNGGDKGQPPTGKNVRAQLPKESHPALNHTTGGRCSRSTATTQ